MRPANRGYKFCSRACYHADRVGRSSFPNSKRTAQEIERTCQQCGATFRSKSSAGARMNYCTRWCQNLAVSARSSVATLTPTEAAYLAGLIDGEGSVVVSDRRATRPGSSHPSVYLLIAGAYAPMHEWIVATTGVGRVRIQPKSPQSVPGATKTVYSWRVHSTQAIAVLKQCVPFMLEKRKRTLRAIRCFEGGYEAFDSESVEFVDWDPDALSVVPISPIASGR